MDAVIKKYNESIPAQLPSKQTSGMAQSLTARNETQKHSKEVTTPQHQEKEVR